MWKPFGTFFGWSTNWRHLRIWPAWLEQKSVAMMIITFGIASKQVSKHVLRMGCSSCKDRITLQYPNRKSEDRNKRLAQKHFKKIETWGLAAHLTLAQVFKTIMLLPFTAVFSSSDSGASFFLPKSFHACICTVHLWNFEPSNIHL